MIFFKNLLKSYHRWFVVHKKDFITHKQVYYWKLFIDKNIFG